MLLHQGLLNPRQVVGKKGILKHISKVGCIQFDPVNIVGRNPDLLLQARVKDYRPGMLDELLYTDRALMDCWDKVSSICRVEDFPFFTRHRQRMCERFNDESKTEIRTALELLKFIRTEGVFDLNQSKNKEMIKWDWGRPVRMERAALEILYSMGKVGIASRVGSRRSFDAIERLFPPEILHAKDPNKTLEAYHEWHLLRRLGGMGLGQMSATEAWLGIQYMKAPERRAAFERLLQKGLVMTVEIENMPGKTFFMRRVDVSTLKRSRKLDQVEPQASFLPPLDNLLWDRKLVSMVFGFDYIWEAYKMPHQRKYGHYTLPVLYGDRFIARFEPIVDRKNRTLVIKNWWWEDGVRPGKEMGVALGDAIRAFMHYLQADLLAISPGVKTIKGMSWLSKV